MNKSDKFTGLVDGGGCHPLFEKWLEIVKLDLSFKKGKLVELLLPKKLSDRRSDKQNRYYWGLIGLITSYTGYEKQEIHDMFGNMFRIKIMIINGDYLKSIESTKTLDAEKMSKYIDQIRGWQQQNLPECYLPTPEEWTEWERKEYLHGDKNETH